MNAESLGFHGGVQILAHRSKLVEYAFSQTQTTVPWLSCTFDVMRTTFCVQPDGPRLQIMYFWSKSLQFPR